MTPAPPNVLVLGDPNDPLLVGLPGRAEGVFVVASDRDALAEAAPRADAILSWWGSRELLDFVLERAPAARWVHSVATGIDRIHSPILAAHRSILTNTRDVFSPALAEFVLLGLLFFAKNTPRMLAARENASWDPFEVETLLGKNLGLVGFGSIGRATARLAQSFGMNILVHRRHPERARSEAFDHEIVTDKRELFARADYVVLAAPLTSETHHLVSVAELAAMKSTGVLVNVGRGALVDEPALVDALTRRAIRGAALDVFATEPLPASHPFFTMSHVLLSPHCADRTATWLREALALFFDNLARFRRAEPLLHPVDKTLGY